MRSDADISPPGRGVGVPQGGVSQVARVKDFVRWLGEVDGAAMTDKDRLELVRALEGVKGAAAAGQARVTVAFADSQRAEQEARGGKAGEVSRSIGSQIALARKDSPSLGDRHVGLARALVEELPKTLEALSAGEVSEYRVTLVAQETATLSPEDRAIADQRLAPDLPTLGTRAVAGAARRIAAELDAASVVRKLERAVASRRVSVRPAPNGMAFLTFLAPLKDAVGAYAAMTRLADCSLGGRGVDAAGDAVDPDGRSRGQLMVDLGIDRIIGRGDGAQVPVEIQLVMTDQSLFAPETVGGDPGTDGHDPETERAARVPATILGHGPIPAALARKMIREADRVWIRRLFTSPDGRNLVAMDSKRRLFEGLRRALLVVRDQTCRTPWCDAPIRQADHVQPSHRDGPTSFMNGSGLCERCNLTKEAAGWFTEVLNSGLDPGSGEAADVGPHRTKVTTPAGWVEESTAPPVLGWGWVAPTQPGRGDARRRFGQGLSVAESPTVEQNSRVEFHFAALLQVA